MKRTLLLITALLMLLPGWAKDDYSYRNISMNDGLPANAVRNIVQDKYGFMWFGTDNGLCRYDGVNVKLYHIPQTGSNQYISAMMAGERGIYIGTMKGVFCLNFETGQTEHLPMDISSEVTSLTADKDGGLWVSTMEQGIWRYDSKTSQAKHYETTLTRQSVAQVCVDHNNQIWAVTNWGEPAVMRLNRLHDKFESAGLTYEDSQFNAMRMLQTKDGRLWLGTWEKGLMRIHSDGRLEQVLSPQKEKLGMHILALYQRSDDIICIGCDDGVVCYNPKTQTWKRLMDELQIPQDRLSDRFVYTITSDKEGGLWTGSFYGGVNYLSSVGKRFKGFSTGDGLSGNIIGRFCEDHQGRMWVASDDGGLMCYVPKEQRFVSYPQQEYLQKRNVHALCMDGNDLWIGTYSDGVLVFDTEKGTLRKYGSHENDPHTLDNISSYAIYKDTHGTIWVATMVGLNRYDRENDRFDRIGEISAVTIDIDEDEKGNLWLSTQGDGLWYYDVRMGTFKKYQFEEGREESLADNQVNCAMVEGNGRLWVGTQGGLCSYDKKSDSFKRITMEGPAHYVMGIIEDNGALWLSTERGILKYESGEPTRRFTLHDGLVSEQFQPNACLKTSDGRIYFGTANGFNSFYPFQIKANSVTPPVYITAIEIMQGKKEQHQLFTTFYLPLHTKDVEIDYDEAKMLNLSFASLSYSSPEKNQYAYMLEGFDSDWNYVGSQDHATYTNLPAGTYLFRVKATNNDGVWSTDEAVLKIVVHPPFWWSWYAKVFYLLLLGALIWQYVHFRLKRAEQHHQLEMQRLSEAKEKEVREARLNFFTMIAHEIRTPVSLIIGPLEKLKSDAAPAHLAPSLLNSLDVIDRNAHRLLELVNQLLDFRKVEQQMLVMHFAPQNIHELIQSVSERFAPTFEHGGRRFTVEAPDEHFTAIVDREAVTKVISNLLTNANKYTKDDVRLSCSVEPDGEHFRIAVTDNGVGIREEDRQRLFEPFFQAQDNKPGTGIGLNIVKNIVEQHHGTISVQSEIGKGSTFTVVLPVYQKETAEGQQKMVEEKKEIEAEQVQYAATEHIPDSHPTMLIVDDSEDMVSFLSSNFNAKYEVITAGDGIEALNVLQKHEVNIIISDWMMPRMDGAEFCRLVRSNPMTSHIPFVMLTAKTDDDSKIQGMDVGADTYIEKPFSVQYLEACIRNMLEMRRRLMEKFSTQPLEPVTEIANNPTDNEFLQKMNQLIEDNFSNSELNVNFLAEQLNISRSGLFAKIKTLADVTPNEMIQIVRLKKAAQLLKDGKYHVGEVGYMVGFSNPSYFSKCFQKQFGITPGAFCNSGDGDAR